MAEEKAFLVPVVIDDTSERHASVPQRFRDVQWTHLAAGDTPASFIERVSPLLATHGQPATALNALERIPPVSASTASPRAAAEAKPSQAPRRSDVRTCGRGCNRAPDLRRAAGNSLPFSDLVA